jgi:hypothetical protein
LGEKLIQIDALVIVNKTDLKKHSLPRGPEKPRRCLSKTLQGLVDLICEYRGYRVTQYKPQ